MVISGFGIISIGGVRGFHETSRKRKKDKKKKERMNENYNTIYTYIVSHETNLNITQR